MVAYDYQQTNGQGSGGHDTPISDEELLGV